jgi:RNA polymerase subunit RPABC4/transcription elongation factor Spt4
MALKPCRECKREVSTDAKACPHCGKANPTGRPHFGAWVAVGILVVVVFEVATNMDVNTNAVTPQGAPRAASKPAAPFDSTPGITRVGQRRAAQMWRDVPTTPGMQRWSCSEADCEVMFDPAMWAQMPYDLKRNVVAMLGIAFAYGRHARFTEIHDMMTNRRLAVYSTRGDNVDID